MNRELRRLQEKEEKRAKQRRGQPRPRRERVGFRQFLREVRQELRRVSWPSRQELWTFTVVVLITTTILTAITFGLDIAFKRGVLALLP